MKTIFEIEGDNDDKIEIEQYDDHHDTDMFVSCRAGIVIDEDQVFDLYKAIRKFMHDKDISVPEFDEELGQFKN